MSKKILFFITAIDNVDLDPSSATAKFALQRTNILIYQRNEGVLPTIQEFFLRKQDTI